MQFVTKEIEQRLASASKVTLETLMSPVDQNAQPTANVQQQNPAKIINVMTHAQDFVGQMPSAKS